MTDKNLDAIATNEKHEKHLESLFDGKQPELGDKSDGVKSPSIRYRLRDPKYLKKLKLSWLIAGAFFNMGLSVGLTGSTLLDLQIITGTDLERASAFVTGQSGGYMTGCLLGGVLFSHMNVHVLLFLSVFGMGASLIATPFCSSYILMILVRVLNGIFSGGLNTSGTATHMQIWGNDGKVLTQVIHFCFALGGVISPLYSEPFLAKRASVNATREDNFTRGSNLTMNTTLDPEGTSVHYTFFISGVFIMLTSLSFLVLYFQSSRGKRLVTQISVDTGAPQRELPLSLHIFLLFMLCTMFTFYASVEVSFEAFLVPFLVKEYDFVTKATAVYIMAIFWISFAASRFAMIFVSKLISAVSLLFLCSTLMLVAFVGFYISAIYAAIPALSVFTAVAGLGVSGFYAGGYAWAESEVMKVTAKVASSICVMSSVGSIVVPLLLANLMEHLSNKWFCYILICQAANTFLMFVFVLLFNRYYVNRRYQTLYLCIASVALEENAQSFLADQKI